MQAQARARHCHRGERQLGGIEHPTEGDSRSHQRHAATGLIAVVTTYLESSVSQVIVTGRPTVTLTWNGVIQPFMEGVQTTQSPTGSNSSGE